MPTEAEIQAEREQLYESSSLRDDIFDDEATALLAWGEQQVIRLAAQDGDFAKLCRFLRQLLKHINRFVGQREFLDAAGQENYMAQVVKWLPELGLPAYSTADMLAVLPSTPNMAADLHAILEKLSPTQAAALLGPPADSPDASADSPSGATGDDPMPDSLDNPSTDANTDEANTSASQPPESEDASTPDSSAQDAPADPEQTDDWRTNLTNRINLLRGAQNADEQENDK